MISFPNVIPLVLATIVALVILISFAYQWTTSRQADYATTVQENDAAFQRLATTLGLRFTPGHIAHHPVTGDIAAFGTVQGTYRGHKVALSVTPEETTEPPVPFHLRITLDAARGESFASVPKASAKNLVVESSRLTLEPHVPSYGRSASYEFYLTLDTRALQAFLDELSDIAETSGSR